MAEGEGPAVIDAAAVLRTFVSARRAIDGLIAALRAGGPQAERIVEVYRRASSMLPEGAAEKLLFGTLAAGMGTKLPEVSPPSPGAVTAPRPSPASSCEESFPRPAPGGYDPARK